MYIYNHPLAPVIQEQPMLTQASQLSSEFGSQQHSTRTQRIEKVIKQLQQICSSMRDNPWQDIQSVKRKFHDIKLKIKQYNITQVRDINIFGILEKGLENFEDKTNLKKMAENHEVKERERMETLRKINSEDDYGLENETDFYKLNYLKLEEQKLDDKILLVYPYPSMRGYIPYPWGKQAYIDGYLQFQTIPEHLKKLSYVFEHVDYTQTIHKVNQLFFLPFDKEDSSLLRRIFEKLMILSGAALLLAILFGLVQSSIIGFVSVGCFLVPCISHSINTVMKSNEFDIKDTQIQVRAKRIQDFFKVKNQQIIDNPNFVFKFEWVINTNKKWKNPLLFLQLRFRDGFPPSEVIYL